MSYSAHNVRSDKFLYDRFLYNKYFIKPILDLISYMIFYVNDVPRFLDIFDLPNYLVLLYNSHFGGYLGPPLPTLISDVINGLSPREK